MTTSGSYRRYGHFDDDRREFVVTDPFPPSTWINYLSNRRLFAILSQTGGGFAFQGDAGTGRLSRYHQYRSVPVNQPGLWVYLREKGGTLWSPSYEPVRTELSQWRCRHGQGYSTYEADYRGLSAELKFFVAQDDDVLLWDLRLTNHRRSPAELTVVPYVEFSFLYALEEIVSYHWSKGTLRVAYDPKLAAIKYHYAHAYSPRRFPVFLSASRVPEQFECSREDFIGRRGTYASPEALIKGKLGGNELPGGGMGIGALSFGARIEPGRSWRLVTVLGAAQNQPDADRMIRKYRQASAADAQFRKLRQSYEEFNGVFQAKLPDENMERFVNTWSPYNCRQTFEHSRFVSSVHTGMEVGGIRTRDSMQDAQAMAHIHPQWAREMIELTLTYEHPQGCYPDNFSPQLKEDHKPHTHTRVDNALWPVFAAYAYVTESGDLPWLSKKLTFYKGSKATVLEHLLLGLKYIFRARGRDGLCLLCGGDWNDEIKLYGDPKAQSVMVSQQLAFACRLLDELAGATRQGEASKWCRRVIRHMVRALNTDTVWDGQWYRRLIFPDDRTPLGSNRRAELKLYPNAQSWAVLSGTATPPRAVSAMDAVWKHASEPYGIRMVWPAATGTPLPPAPLLSKHPGIGENGGVFNQPCAWAIMAETVLGRGDHAFKLYRQCLPPVICDSVGVDRYRNEPYCYSSHLMAPPQPQAGRGDLPWLTGTAACMYMAATQYILGIRPTSRGLQIDPCIPKAWPGFRAQRRFRGVLYDIEIRNPGGMARGVGTLTVEGRTIRGNVVPPIKGKRRIRVIATLGAVRPPGE